MALTDDVHGHEGFVYVTKTDSGESGLVPGECLEESGWYDVSHHSTLMFMVIERCMLLVHVLCSVVYETFVFMFLKCFVSVQHIYVFSMLMLL